MPLRTDDRNAKLATMQPLILASASPQRRTLLQGLGISFEVMPSSVDEKSHPEKADPAVRAQILAREKANDVAAKMPGRWVLGCDTLVVAPDGSILEKPSDADDARRMLRLQSGGVSLVHSGLTLISPEGARHVGVWHAKALFFEGCSSSRVHFKKLSCAEVAWWIQTNQWKDRSGAFQIDGLGQLLIEHLEGDWTSVVGLPVFLFGELVEQAGLGQPPTLSSIVS